MRALTKRHAWRVRYGEAWRISSARLSVLICASSSLRHFVTASLSSAAAHEEPVEFAKRDLVPGRPAVVALAGALGRLHLAQQGVHLRDRELAVGAHSGMARHGRQQLVAPLGEDPARAVLANFAQHI